MHYSFLEKFGLSVLVCAWLIYGANFLGNVLIHADDHAVAAIPHGTEAPAATATAPEPEPEVDFPTLLAAADPADGARVFRKCTSCHTTEQGGANRVGPNLWNVVGSAPGGVDGFSYSGAITGLTQVWDYEALDAFLAKPRDYAPGNKMTFAGLRKPEDRAEVIAYLRTLSDNPLPLP